MANRSQFVHTFILSVCVGMTLIYSPQLSKSGLLLQELDMGTVPHRRQSSAQIANKRIQTRIRCLTKETRRQPRVAQTAVSPCASEARFTKSSLGPKILTIGAGKSNLVISTWRRSAQGGRVSVESPRRDRIRFGQIRNQMHFGDASGGSSWFI